MRAACGIAYSLLILSVLAACAPVAEFDSIQVEEQLSNLLELHTYEHIYRDVVYFGEEKSFLVFRTVDRAILFSIDIRVRAGIDLQQGLRIALDEDDPQKIYVQLPPASILGIDADETSIREYFIRERGGRIGLLELTGQLDDVKDRVSQDAVERGILQRAEANARRVVRNFFALAGFTSVEFAPAQAPSEGIQG